MYRLFNAKPTPASQVLTILQILNENILSVLQQNAHKIYEITNVIVHVSRCVHVHSASTIN